MGNTVLDSTRLDSTRLDSTRLDHKRTRDKKTKYMVFHTPQRKVTYPEIKINNLLIERVSEFSFLGIIFNSNLNGIPTLIILLKQLLELLDYYGD